MKLNLKFALERSSKLKVVACHYFLELVSKVICVPFRCMCAN